MKTLLYSLVLISVSSFAGEWSRVSPTIIKFDGYLGVNDALSFKNIISHFDDTLIVDSRGGSAEIGLELGILISNWNLKVVVDGFCVSSCANYIFTAGKEKEIVKGFVGFHGNITAFLKYDWEMTVQKLRDDGLSPQDISQLYERFRGASAKEQQFLEALGVSQDLFDRSQLADKGTGNGNSYNFLVPSREAFVNYGILNVSGNQDPFFGSELGIINLYE